MAWPWQSQLKSGISKHCVQVHKFQRIAYSSRMKGQPSNDIPKAHGKPEEHVLLDCNLKPGTNKYMNFALRRSRSRTSLLLRSHLMYPLLRQLRSLDPMANSHKQTSSKSNMRHDTLAKNDRLHGGVQPRSGRWRWIQKLKEERRTQNHLGPQGYWSQGHSSSKLENYL